MDESKLYAIELLKCDMIVRSRKIADVCKETGSIYTLNGRSESPYSYIVFDDEAKRDGAFQAFRDMAMIAVKYTWVKKY